MNNKFVKQNFDIILACFKFQKSTTISSSFPSFRGCLVSSCRLPQLILGKYVKPQSVRLEILKPHFTLPIRESTMIYGA